MEDPSIKKLIILSKFEIILNSNKTFNIYGRSKEDAKFVKEYVKKYNPLIDINENNQDIKNQFKQMVINKFSR